MVAEEVRNLAQKSADAVKNTTDLIDYERNSVNDGAKYLHEVSLILAEINTHVSKAKEIISEVSTASQEQTKGIELVSLAVSEIEKSTQRISADAKESVLSVEGLFRQTRELDAMAQKLSYLIGLKDTLAVEPIETGQIGRSKIFSSR